MRPILPESRLLRAAFALTAFCLLMTPAVALSDQREDADPQQDPQARRERVQVLREMEALGDSLDAAFETIRAGESAMERFSRELRRLEDDIDRLENSSEDVEVRTRLYDLRRRIMTSRLRRGMGRAPGTEGSDPADPEWDALTGTSSRRDIFRMGGDVEVGIFERVRGDVVVIGGKVTVRGTVTGNVVSVGNDVHITPTGRVDGDAVSIGGRITQDPGGTVRGDFVEPIWPNSLPFLHSRSAWLAFSLAGFAFVLIAVIIVGLIVPSNVGLVEQQVRTRFGTSFLIGLGSEILLPIIFVLLCITIVGIPVALVLLPIAVFGLFLLGFTGVALAVGRGLANRGLQMGNSPLGLITIGAILLQAVYLVGRAVHFTGGLVGPIGLATQLIGFLVLYVAWTSGMGAAMLTRFGTRRQGQAVEPKPAPPPVGSQHPVGA